MRERSAGAATAATCTYDDLTHELKPDSPDTLQLRALMSMVTNSADTNVVDEAANRLYFVMIQQPLRTGRRVSYCCPELVGVLEDRQTADFKKGCTSYASRNASVSSEPALYVVFGTLIQGLSEKLGGLAALDHLALQEEGGAL